MAGKVALWLSCLLLVLLGATGCTWTDTYQEYPPSVRTDGGLLRHFSHSNTPPAVE